MLIYSDLQLLKYNNYSTPVCISAIKQSGLLRRPRYIHRGSRRKFVYTRSSITSIWSAERNVARLLRHQSAVTAWSSVLGNTARHTEWVRKPGADHSLLRPVQKIANSPHIKIELLNTQSLTGKASFIHDHILENRTDFMCLTETWHQPEVYSAINEACPSAYTYLQKARSTGRGGGLVIIHQTKFKLSALSLPEFSSFECLAFKCKPPFPMTILLIYRLPKPNSAFVDEMHDLLTTIGPTSTNLLILGNMNIHVDTPSCRSAAEFLQLLDCLNLTQHVDVPTHTRGHTLDLVITDSASINNLQVHDLGLSDHKLISVELPFLPTHSKPKRQICFRNIKNIDPDTLTLDLHHLSSANLSSASESVTFYNNSLCRLLDLHAPIKTKTVSFVRSAPWYTLELRKMKARGRILERCFKTSALTVHRLAYRDHQQAYSKSLQDARSQFFSDIINNNPGNSKQLFSTINHLLKPQTKTLTENTEERCNNFITFFRTKIDSIRSHLPGSTALPALSVSSQSGFCHSFHCFSEVSQLEIEGIIKKMKSSSCALDPFPTILIKSNLSAISPLITKTINHSLQSGHVPFPPQNCGYHTTS